MKKNIKHAFTLAEVMVTLALISIIATILIPAIMQVKPDRYKLLFKKAYTITERVVGELVNDDNLYPLVTGKVGLDNTATVTLNDKTYSGNTKFCQLFAMKVNIVESTASCTGSTSVPSFTTNDGIVWYLPTTSFAGDAAIKVDVNGDKAPNCEYNTTNCLEPDTFHVIIGNDGRVSVNGVREREFLRSNETIKR